MDSLSNPRTQYALTKAVGELRNLAWGVSLAVGTSASIFWILLLSPMAPAIQDLKADIHAALGLSVGLALALTAACALLQRRLK